METKIPLTLYSQPTTRKVYSIRKCCALLIFSLTSSVSPSITVSNSAALGARKDAAATTARTQPASSSAGGRNAAVSLTSSAVLSGGSAPASTQRIGTPLLAASASASQSGTSAASQLGLHTGLMVCALAVAFLYF